MSGILQALLATFGAGGAPPAAVGTWNPADKDPDITLSGGDLVATISGANGFVRGTVGRSSGVGQFEIVTSGDSANHCAGLANGSALLDFFPGYPGDSYSYYDANGYKYNDLNSGNPGVAYGATWTTGDVIGVVWDATAGELRFYKNGASQGVAFSGLSGTFYPAWGPGTTSGSSRSCTLNCGQTAFTYPISGADPWG